MMFSSLSKTSYLYLLFLRNHAASCFSLDTLALYKSVTNRYYLSVERTIHETCVQHELIAFLDIDRNLLLHLYMNTEFSTFHCIDDVVVFIVV